MNSKSTLYFKGKINVHSNPQAISTMKGLDLTEVLKELEQKYFSIEK